MIQINTDNTLGEFQERLMELGHAFHFGFAVGDGIVSASVVRGSDRAIVGGSNLVEVWAHLANWAEIYATEPENDQSSMRDGTVADLARFLGDRLNGYGMTVGPGPTPATEVRVECVGVAEYWVAAHRLQGFNLPWKTAFDIERDVGHFDIEIIPF